MLVTRQNVLDYLGRTLGDVPAQDTQISFFLSHADSAVKKFVGFDVEQATFTEYYPEVGTNVFNDEDLLVSGYELTNGKAVPFSRGDNSRAVILLRKKPVRSVTSVYENPGAWSTAGGDWPATSLLDPASYQLDLEKAGFSATGQLLRRAGAWTTARRAIKVTYVAGYTAGELDLSTGAYPQFTTAACMTVAFWLMKTAIINRVAQAGGMISSQGMDGYSISFMSPPGAGLLGVIQNGMPSDACLLLSEEVSMRKYF